MFERICIILLVNFLYFFKTITYKYTSDDLQVYRIKREYKNKLHRIFLQIRGDVKFNEQQDHLITMVSHALVCVFIYTAFGATDISFLAAILFCFNPINNQGSVWMSGRGYVFSALFNLMAISIPVMSPIFMLCTTYYNLGYVAPMILIGSKVSWIMWFMPFIWLFWFKKFKRDVRTKMQGESFAEDKRLHPKKIILAIKTFAFYFSHALVPWKTTFYHSYMQSLAGSGKVRGYKIDRFFWIGILALSGIFWYWFTHKWDLISFGLFWWCLGIGPFLNIRRMSQEIAERYAYLPNVGLMYVLASLIVGNPYLTAGFIVMYATKMWFYMDAYQDDYYLIENACLNSPDSWFAWHVRGMRRWNAQSYKEAVIMWVMAKMISPKEFKLLFNIATSLMIMKNKDEALAYLKLASENIPEGQEEEAGKLIEEWKKGNMGILL